MEEIIWTITAKRLPIVGVFGGHLYFEIRDNTGLLKEQIHGLATEEDGTVVPMGFDADFIKGYFTIRDGKGIFLGDGSTSTNNTHEGILLYSGSEATVKDAMKYAASAIEFINAQEYNYQAIPDSKHYNSNSVFAGVMNAMQKTISISASL